MDVIRTERGWAGHYVCSDRCKFRRNTLLECAEVRVVVSTVGCYWPEEQVAKILRMSGGPPCEIGYNRYYETRCFHAVWDGHYWEADVAREVAFESDWAIEARSPKKLNRAHAAIANRMHEDVVDEISRRMAEGDTFFVREM